MFQINQCVMSIFEPLASTGSGSCMSSTKLCVPIGTCDHLSSGDGAVAPAACVYLSGMTPPSSHAVDVMIRGGVAGPRPPPLACPPPPGACAIAGVDPSAHNVAAASRPFADRTFLRMAFLLARTDRKSVV